MSKKIVITFSIITILAIMFFIYPSINQSISAEQSNFTGHENHIITLQEGMDLTKAFRITAKSNDVLAQYCGSDALEKILAQYGCVGLRMYYGKHKDGSPALVIVGVDNKGNDMTSGYLAQRFIPCPPLCSQRPELQQDKSFANLK